MSNTQIVEAQASIAPQTGLSVYDKGTFDQMCQVATMMAKTALIPESLKGKTEDETMGNCFLVVEQSHRWGLSAFAVAQCASVIHGRLMWEGKLVSAVISANLGVDLDYQFSGSGEQMSVIVSGTLPGEAEPRTVQGGVKGWKSSQWKTVDYEQRLSYRGAREWARRHASAVMLGVTTDDEELPKPPQRNITPQAEAIDPFKKHPVIEEKVEGEKPQSLKKEPKGAKGLVVIMDSVITNSKEGEKPWQRCEVILKTSQKEIKAVTWSTRIAGIIEYNKGEEAYVWLTKSGDAFDLNELELVNAMEGGLC